MNDLAKRGRTGAFGPAPHTVLPPPKKYSSHFFSRSPLQHCAYLPCVHAPPSASQQTTPARFSARCDSLILLSSSLLPSSVLPTWNVAKYLQPNIHTPPWGASLPMCLPASCGAALVLQCPYQSDPPPFPQFALRPCYLVPSRLSFISSQPYLLLPMLLGLASGMAAASGTMPSVALPPSSPEFHGVLHQLSHRGDFRMMWDGSVCRPAVERDSFQ